MGVFFDVWLLIFMNEISTWSGVLESKRTKSVSVVIFSGIRLRMTIRNGRISCPVARVVSMTKMFSCFSNSIAGNLSGNFNGMNLSFFCFGA